MHKTTNHVFSQFIRLQPWAFSLSLAGLLTLGSCAPPATQKPPLPTTPSSSPIWLDNVPNLKPPTPQTNQNLHFGLGDFKIQGYPLCGNTPEEAQESYGGANACYSAGGSPLWSQQKTGNLDWFGRPEICITFNKCEFPVGGGGGNGNENPDNDNCEGKCDGAGAAPFDLLMVHNNLPPNGLKPLGDDVQSQVTISPADVNDAYDSARLVINDRDNKGWKLELFKPNGKRIYEESGLGNSVAGWDGLDENLALSNGIYRAKLTQIENPGIVLERTIRVDNEKPVFSNIRVQEEPSANRYTVKATLKEAGNGTFQSGVNPAKTKLFFDDGVDRDDANKDYNAETGEYSVTFSDLAQYRIAKQQSQQQNGYDFPFELQIADYAGNQASNRGSGPDGPLRIQVLDPYFSPNGDGVKDSLNFKVIAETSEVYSVQVKRNGATVKSWAGLTGEQNLSWDGMQNGQALADGSYRIVAMTERQRDRVRDAQMVVLDNSPPEISFAFQQSKDGKRTLRAVFIDRESGLEPLSSEIQGLNNWNFNFSSSLEKNEKRLIQEINVIEPPYPEAFIHTDGFTIAQAQPNNGQNAEIDVASTQIQNRAGVSKVAPVKVNQNVQIILNSVTEQPNHQILLEGKVLLANGEKNHPTFDFQSLSPDFGGDIEVLTTPEITANPTQGTFKIKVKDYRITDAYLDKAKSFGIKDGPAYSAKVVSLAEAPASGSFRITATPGLSEIFSSEIAPYQIIKEIEPGKDLNQYKSLLGQRFHTKDANSAIEVVTFALSQHSGIYKNYFATRNYHPVFKIPSILNTGILSGFFCTKLKSQEMIFYNRFLEVLGRAKRPSLKLEIGNGAFRNLATLQSVVAHELFHRAQYLTGEQFSIGYSQIEAAAYQFTINNLTVFGFDPQENAEAKAFLAQFQYGSQNTPDVFPPNPNDLRGYDLAGDLMIVQCN